MSDSESSSSLELHDIQWEDANLSSISSSSPELHDIDWGEMDSAFSYEDRLSQSPQALAVIDNNVALLKKLIESGKSVNVNNNQGHTPLHLSILYNRKEAFDYLITVEDLRIDAKTFEGATPLMLAVVKNEEYFTHELLKKGADANVTENTGNTVLHYAIKHSVPLAEELILKGSDINARNDSGETPIFLACDGHNSDHVFMFLYYGADPKVANAKDILPFDLSLSKCPPEIREILFDYTFDEYSAVTLHTVVSTMLTESHLFHKLMEKNLRIVYSESDLRKLANNLASIPTETFKVFINKNDDLARDFFKLYNPIDLYRRNCYVHSKSAELHFTDLFLMLCESRFIEEIVDGFRPENFFGNTLVKPNLLEDTQTKLIFSLLSYGARITSYDINNVFTGYGYGFLFKLLLHQEIVGPRFVVPTKDFLPRMIYEPHLKITSYFTPRFFNTDLFTELNRFFRLVHWRYVMEDFRVDVHDVPSLVELAREAARDLLMEKCRKKNNVHFFTMLKWLPVHQFLKEILSYEKPIYGGRRPV